ncbi:MAG: FAD-binding oxidoreductase [Sedimentisphaeraceae bacterium JB056]
MEPQQYKPKLGWQDSSAWGLCLIIAYCVIAIIPVLIIKLTSPPVDEPLMVNTALMIALTGFNLLCLQIFLAGRFRNINRPFGIDMVMKFHKTMAITALVLLLSHPILIALHHKSWTLFSFSTSWKVNLGKAALLILLLGILFALFFRKLKIDYNVWHFLHKSMIFIIIFAFFHGIVIGPHIKSSFAIRVFWYAIFFSAIAVFCYRNFIVPFIRKKYIVDKVSQETHNTYTLSLKPEKNITINRNPGQFMFLKLIRPGQKPEIHPFTISASPLQDGTLEATIKESGNFTNTINKTKLGDKARIEAPFGRFSYIYHKAEKILFIAGGVGITPALSMIRCLRETGDKRPVTLLYANNQEKDIICREELESLPENFKTVFILKDPSEDWNGEKGYINQHIIDKHASEIMRDAHVYLCGPPPMMDAVISCLHQLDIDNSRIHYEMFTL